LPARFTDDFPSLPVRPLAFALDPAACATVVFDADDVSALLSPPERAEPRAALAAPFTPTRWDALEDGVFRAGFAAPLPLVAGPAVPADLGEACGAVSLRAAVFAIAGREAAVSLPVDALVERRPADFPAAFAGAARLVPPRAATVVPVGLRVDAFRIEATFAGAGLLAAVFFDAVFFAIVPVDAAVAGLRLVDALPAAAVFVAGRARDVFVAADLPPVPGVAVLPTDAFLAAGLLAPVFLPADLRGLLVAMHSSRGLVAPRGGPSSISPAACREGDRANARRAGVNRTTARTTPAGTQAPPAVPAAA
jgi:hypothetical protein